MIDLLNKLINFKYLHQFEAFVLFLTHLILSLSNIFTLITYLGSWRV